MIGRCHQGGRDDGHFPPTKRSWSRCKQYSAKYVYSDSPNLRSLLNKSDEFACCSVEIVSSQKRDVKWSSLRVLFTIAIPGLCSESDFRKLGNLIYRGHQNVFYTHTLHITAFAEHQLEEGGF